MGTNRDRITSSATARRALLMAALIVAMVVVVVVDAIASDNRRDHRDHHQYSATSSSSSSSFDSPSSSYGPLHHQHPHIHHYKDGRSYDDEDGYGSSQHVHGVVPEAEEYMAWIERIGARSRSKWATRKRAESGRGHNHIAHDLVKSQSEAQGEAQDHLVKSQEAQEEAHDHLVKSQEAHDHLVKSQEAQDHLVKSQEAQEEAHDHHLVKPQEDLIQDHLVKSQEAQEEEELEEEELEEEEEEARPLFSVAAGSDAVASGSSLVLVRSDAYLFVDSVKGPFHTVQAAVDAVPKHNAQRVVIKISAGVYEEKVKVPKSKPFVTFLGEGADQTKITWHDTSASSNNSTFRSASVSVMANGFVARNLAFENSSPHPRPGAVGAQAVAFQISGDQSAFYDCAFYGAQDTLYDHRGRHYFKNCLIQGSIDFVFGDGRSLYEECELRTLDISAGSVTAQKRKTGDEDTGFAFVDCRITGPGMVYLGRAWGAYSRVVYIRTYIGAVILSSAWNDWGIASRQNTSFYATFECFGPGADLRNEVAWAHNLTPDQAAPFMSLSFIDGESWLPLMS